MCPPKDELRGRSSLSEVKSGAIKSILCNWILSPGRTSLRTASAFRAQTRRAHFDSRRAACRIRCVSFRFAQTARKDQGPESLKLGALPLTAAETYGQFDFNEKPALHFCRAGLTFRGSESEICDRVLPKFRIQIVDTHAEADDEINIAELADRQKL